MVLHKLKGYITIQYQRIFLYKKKYARLFHENREKASPVTGSLPGGLGGYRSAPVRPSAPHRWVGEQASPEAHQSGDEVAARTDIERHPVRHSQ